MKHRYTVDNPKGGHFFNEGVLGYLWNVSATNLTPLYLYYSDFLDGELLSFQRDIQGFEETEFLGYYIDFNAMVGFASERSNY